VKVRTPEREVVGTVDDYESLSRVRIITRTNHNENGFEWIETSALVSVDYQSD
jgi:hypothetical protein